ncbi:MAG: hypothetical protein COA84_15425 [Robiginitomaculum sp.]|nr:MAG: hypothetical protein COA84_15425 [Robiginitomaculum sp.]
MKRFAWLDYFRFSSAVAVVMFHYTVNNINNGSVKFETNYGIVSDIFQYGYLGVDVFFIISGFVILLSAMGRTPAEFAVSRATRLFPAFLFCMTLTTCVVFFSGMPTITLPRYIANLTMVPAHIGFEAVDGVYWSLAFEILFYATVFAILLIGRIKHIRKILAAYTTVSLVLFLIDAHVFGFGGYFMLFAAGCALYLIYHDSKKAFALVLFAVSAMLSVVGAHERASEILESGRLAISPATVSIILSAVYVCFYSLTVFIGSNINLPYSREIGATTYPLYLIHNVIGIILFQKINHTYTQWEALLFVTTIIIVMSFLIYRFYEKITYGFWRDFFKILFTKPIQLMKRIRIHNANFKQWWD